MNRRSKTRLFSSVIIFISGYIPLFMIMIIKDFSSFANIDFIGFSLCIPLFKNGSIVFVLFILSTFSILFLWYVMRNISKRPFEITIISAKSRSSEVVNYTIPYMISFVAFDLNKTQDIISLILFLSVLCLLSVRSQSVFINPILAAFGYGIYDCIYKERNIEKSCVMLSRKDLFPNESEKFVKLNNYMGIISN